MERMRLKDGSEYDVVPGGLRSSKNENGDDVLRIVLRYDENISFEDIEAEFSDRDNIEDICLTGYDSSAVDQVMSGYTILRSISRCDDYIAARRIEISDGVYSLQGTRESTYVVILEKPSEQDQMRASIDDINGTVDTLVLEALEDSGRFDDMQDVIDALVLDSLEG